MIFGLPAILGFVPLLLYIVLMIKGKDMIFSVLLCVLLGAVMTGETLTGFGQTLYTSLGSFLSLIGFTIILGSGLGEVLTHTRVAHDIVYLVVGKAKLKSQKQAVFLAMATSTILVALLGTMSGSNAILAPIIIPIVASLGLTPATLSVVLHGAGAVGLFVGPFVPPVVTIMGLTGLSYSEYMLNAGLPIGGIVWITTFFMAWRIQKQSEGKISYSEEDRVAENLSIPKGTRKGTIAFTVTMILMLIYGITAKAGASYAIVVVLAAALITGFASGLSFTETLKIMVKGSSRMYGMFFMFLLLDPFLNYIAASGAFDAIVSLIRPLIDAGGVTVFLILVALVGIFGISGAGVAQAKIVYDMFLPTVAALNVQMGIWAMIVLVSSQITFFALPSADMMGNMGMAHATDMKPLLKNGVVITALVLIYVVVRSALYAAGHQV